MPGRPKPKENALPDDEIDDAAGNEDGFFDGFAFELFGGGGDGLGGRDDIGFGGIFVNFDGAAHFAHDLDGHFDERDFAFGRVVGGPGGEGDAGFVAQNGPEFLGDVGGVGGEQENEGFCGNARDFVEFGELVDVNHQLGNAGVEAEIFDVLAEFTDGLMAEGFGFGVAWDVGDAFVEGVGILGDEEAPATGEEAVDAGNAFGIPGFDLIERAHEHLVEAEGVGAVFSHDVVGIDDVAPRFGHFFDLHFEGFAGEFADGPIGGFLDIVDVDVCAVFVFVGVAEDHALIEEFLEGFLGVDESDVVEDFVPEPGVEEVEDGVFGASDVEIDGHPVFFVGCAKWSRVVVGVDVAQVIPA